MTDREVAEFWLNLGCHPGLTPPIEQLNRIIKLSDEMLDALKGVVRVADRATDEFDAARKVIAKATGEQL